MFFSFRAWSEATKMWEKKGSQSSISPPPHILASLDSLPRWRELNEHTVFAYACLFVESNKFQGLGNHSIFIVGQPVQRRIETVSAWILMLEFNQSSVEQEPFLRQQWLGMFYTDFVFMTMTFYFHKSFTNVPNCILKSYQPLIQKASCYQLWRVKVTFLFYQIVFRS